MIPVMLIANPHHGPYATTASSVISGLGNITNAAGVYEASSASAAHGVLWSERAHATTWSAAIMSASGVYRHDRKSARNTSARARIFTQAGFAASGVLLSRGTAGTPGCLG